MRYFVVTYIQKPDGQYDEQVQVLERNLTNKVNITANVILDFKEKKVVKARLAEAIDRDWDLLRNYFHQVYPQVIEQLELGWSKKEDSANTESPSADNESS
jgi:hypothetical protein